MRHALVVFESMFGNTQTIAQAVLKGLSSHIPAVILEVGSAPAVLADDVELLVVGGPTHAFGMSRPRTREDATRQAGGHVVSGQRGLREWLASLERGTGDVAAAAFDTRIDKPRMPGSAARRAEKRLRNLGFHVAAPPESFYVTGTAGPLVDGKRSAPRHGARSSAEDPWASTQEHAGRSPGGSESSGPNHLPQSELASAVEVWS